METRCGRLFQQIISIATRPAKHYKGYKGTFYFFRETQTVSFNSDWNHLLRAGPRIGLFRNNAFPGTRYSAGHKQARFYLTVTTVV